MVVVVVVVGDTSMHLPTALLSSALDFGAKTAVGHTGIRDMLTLQIDDRTENSAFYLQPNTVRTDRIELNRSLTGSCRGRGHGRDRGHGGGGQSGL